MPELTIVLLMIDVARQLVLLTMNSGTLSCGEPAVGLHPANLPVQSRLLALETRRFARR